MANIFGTESLYGADAGVKAYQGAIHQSLMDAFAKDENDRQNQELEIQRRQEQRLEEQAHAKESLEERQDIRKELNDTYIAGDFIDTSSQLYKRAKAAGVEIPMTPPTPVELAKHIESQAKAGVGGPVVGPGAVAPAPIKPMPLRFAGSPADRVAKNEADENKRNILAFAATLPPGTPERTALEYNATTISAANPKGLNPTAGMFQSQSEDVFRVSPLDKARMEHYVAGTWVPWTGGAVPKGARILQETNPPVAPMMVVPTGTAANPTVSVVPKTAGKVVDARTPKAAPAVNTLNAEQRLAFQAALKLKSAQFKGIFGKDPTDENIDDMTEQAFNEAKKVGGKPSVVGITGPDGKPLDFNAGGGPQ